MMSNENTDSFDSNCCTTCKADVDISRETIHGPSDTLYEVLTRSNSYPDGAGVFKKEWESAKIRLNRLIATIALLESEKKRLEGIMEKYEVILHPARTMPANVLQHVFGLCADHIEAPMELPPQWKSSLARSKMHWVLSQVCRSWRTLSLSTPQLWTTVCLNIQQIENISNSQSMSSSVQRLGLQLHRSQDHPLTVMLFGGPPATVTVPRTIVYRNKGATADPTVTASLVLLENHPLLILLYPSSYRWQHLLLEGHPAVLARLSSVRGLLSQLETVSIGLSEHVNLGDSLADCLEFAPRLKSVSMFTLPTPPMKLPRNPIEHFRFKRPESRYAVQNPSHQLSTILQHFSSLQVCEIHFDDALSIQRSTRDLTRPMLASFTTLIISESRPHSSSERTGVLAEFIGRISAPSLTCLQIGSQFSCWAEFLSFLTRSKCRLTSLTIPKAASLPASTFREVLSATQDLETLELGFVDGLSNDHVAVFSLLTIVPRLQRLTFVRVHGMWSAYQDLLITDLLEYRWNIPEDAAASGTERLHFVSLDRKLTSAPLVRERLNPLIAQGMTVVESASST